MASINDLPDDLLGHILNYCPKTLKSVHDLSNVCQKWGRVVDQQQGVYMFTGKDNGVQIEEVKGCSRLYVLRQYSEAADALRASSEASPTTEGSAATLAPKACGDSNTPAPDISNEQLHQKLLCSPDYVRKLCFVGKMPIQVPAALMMMCNNLSGLHFHLSSLVGLNLTLPLTMDLPTLKSFVIDSYGMKEYWSSLQLQSSIPGSFLNMEELLIVASRLLNQNLFPRLEYLLVDVPFCAEKENMMVTSLASFLGRHHKQIQSFCYYQGFRVQIPTPTDSDDEDDVNLPNLAASAAELKKVSLKELHIGLHTPQESDPLWINFLIQQCHLDKVIFTGDNIPFPARTMQVNHTTLSTVIMEVRDNVDIQALQNCVRLKRLTLLGNAQDEEQSEDFEDEEFDANLNIANLHLLPKSVQDLRINRLKIDAGATNELICSGQWTNLNKLELIDCGVEGNLGVPLKAIGFILEHKQLQQFIIYFSLNRKSLEEPSLPTSLEHWAYGLRFTFIPGFKIHGTLTSSGKYEDHVQPADLHPKYLVQVGELDLFHFPEQIYPTGYYKSSLNTKVEENAEEEKTEDTSAGGEEESDDDDSYEDIDDTASLP